MRVAVWVAALGACLGLASTARGDIYQYRTQSGALVFTNAPVENATRFIIVSRKPVLRPAPRVMVPGIRPAAFTTALSQPIPAAAPTSYDALIRDVAERYDVEYALVKAVIKAESDFNRLAVSPKGALGLMQLMPETAAQHMVRNVFLPRDNIEGGTRHLRMLLDRYRGNLPLAIAAYNAGTKRVEEAGGIPPIPETREYLVRVLRYRLAYLREGAGVVALRR